MRKRTIHKAAAALTALALCAGVLTGCGGAASGTASSVAASSAASSEASGADADELAAQNVADLIDAIYVQQRTDDTDAQCEAAKAAWDALTDAQKELVEGENADPDYFGRDTGDASKDDARNADEIGENELLVVSFGTSFNDSRAADIKGIEDAIQAAYPDWSVRRAFTAQIIINHVQARDGEKIDNMEQALERAVANGVKNLVVQPTHLMHGAEYDEMMEMVDSYRDKFESVAIAEPLLGEVGSDATVINADKEAVAKAITAEAVKTAGFDSLDAAAEDGTAFVFMGHGTSHTAKVSYTQMQSQMNALGYKNVFIGTVEGEPEETACENVIEAVKDLTNGLGADVVVEAAGTAGEAGTAHAELTNRVVLLAIFLLAQHVIGFGDVLELLLGFLGLVDVRMVFAGELAVRLLDVVVRSVLGDTKDFVEVFAEPFVFSHSCLLSRKVFM